MSTGFCTSCSNCYSPSDLTVGRATAYDAGPALTIDFGANPITVPPAYPGSGYYLYSPPNKYFWNDRRYTISSTGGSQVGAFSFETTLSTTATTFANIVRFQPTSRSADLTVKWTDNDPSRGRVIVSGASFTNDGAGSVFQCAAPASATEMTIPSWILSTLPASGTLQDGTPYGYLWIGQDTTSSFTAPGLDKGILANVFYLFRQVKYQ